MGVTSFGKRKGVLYSVIAVTVLAPLLFYLVVYLNSLQTQEEHTVLKVRGVELANYMESISLDVPRILDITSKLAFVAALNEIDANGTPLDDARLRLQELMRNGTLYGSNSTFLNSSNLGDWSDRMEQLGTRFGLQTNVTISNLNISLSNSFTLNFSMNVIVNSTDPLTQIRVDRAYFQTALVSVEGFEDPLYPLETNGFVKRIVNRTVLPQNISAVNNASLYKLYWSSSEGASFLDRMEGRYYLSAAYNVTGTEGLESFVDLAEISAVGVSVRTNQSVVDFNYFSPLTIDGCPVVNASYSWFKLDSSSASKYNVNASC